MLLLCSSLDYSYSLAVGRFTFSLSLSHAPERKYWVLMQLWYCNLVHLTILYNFRFGENWVSHSVGIAKILITCENILSFFSSLLSVFVANFFVFLCVCVLFHSSFFSLCIFGLSFFPINFWRRISSFQWNVKPNNFIPEKIRAFWNFQFGSTMQKKEPKSDIGRMLMHSTQKEKKHREAREPERESENDNTSHKSDNFANECSFNHAIHIEYLIFSLRCSFYGCIRIQYTRDQMRMSSTDILSFNMLNANLHLPEREIQHEQRGRATTKKEAQTDLTLTVFNLAVVHNVEQKRTNPTDKNSLKLVE